jgi:hypothetical protein
LFDRGNYRKTYADKEVITTSILRVRLVRLRGGFAAFVVMKERCLDTETAGGFSPAVCSFKRENLLKRDIYLFHNQFTRFFTSTKDRSAISAIISGNIPRIDNFRRTLKTFSSFRELRLVF